MVLRKSGPVVFFVLAVSFVGTTPFASRTETQRIGWRLESERAVQTKGLRGPLPHLMLRGGARDDSIQFQSRRRDSPGRQQGTMNPDVRLGHGTGENDIVLDMRTDEEIALLQSMAEKPAEPAVEISTEEYPESRRAAYLREQALKMIPDFVSAWPEGNTSTEEMLEVWNEMQQGTNTPAHTLADAAAANDVSEIEELLASGQVSVDSLCRDSRTALMHATEHGRVEAVCVLLRHGADTEVCP